MICVLTIFVEYVGKNPQEMISFEVELNSIKKIYGLYLQCENNRIWGMLKL